MQAQKKARCRMNRLQALRISLDFPGKRAWHRGVKIDNVKAIQNNLGRTFKTVDKLDGRVLQSTKSYNTIASYKSPNSLFKQMKGDIDTLNKFTGYAKNGSRVSPAMYDQKALNAVFPNQALSPNHLYELQRAIEYAESLNIHVDLWKTN